MSLQSVAVSFFNVSIAIFEKGACQQSASFPQATLFMNFATGTSKHASFQPALKLCDVLECPNASGFHSSRTIIHCIEK